MKMSLFGLSILLINGCASVPMETKQKSDQAKMFNPPSENKAGVYVYRKDTHFGAALKKDVFVDQECVGETAKGIFFHREVDGDQKHTVSTESEFSDNDLVVFMKSGANYFFEQFIKFGVFVGGAGLEQRDENAAKPEIKNLKLAKSGICNSK